MSLKLVSLNIEGNNHLDLVIPFLQQQQPDVICLQEVFVHDFSHLKQALQMDGLLVPTLQLTIKTEYQLQPFGAMGVAILTNLPAANFQHQFYVQRPEALPELTSFNPNAGRRALIWANLIKDGQQYTVATTHFTWSSAGTFTPEQATDAESMVRVLAQLPDFVLCGDFNSPRGGGGVFDQLATKFVDHIPSHYQTSLDPKFHRAGKLNYLVDGLFSTANYAISHVEVVDGVSDHMAVVAEINHS